ncbi:MAG: hypothetical protein PVS2B2_18600 [Candidatus Acidiferrum sp.]
MRKLMVAAGLLLASACASRAQDTPKVELSTGYSFLREGGSGGVNANGATVSVAGNLNHWIGLVGDLGAYRASPSGASLNTYTFLVGPRFTYRKPAGIQPFVQVLAGGAHLTAAVGGFSGSTTAFAYSAGGGVDLGFSRRISLRPQIDYIGIRSQGSTLNTARVSIGIVFRFGSR